MAHTIGATSYVFRYVLSDPSVAPTIRELIAQAAAEGLDRLQICENARPLDLSCAEWTAVKKEADRIGLQLSLGCMTLDPAVVEQYLDRVQAIDGSMLRIVLERNGPSRLTLEQIRQFLDGLVPALERRRVRLAIENHVEIPAQMLAESVVAYPGALIGFCIDVANSLRNFEDSDRASITSEIGPFASI